jgi:hypothetical protein
MCVLVAFNTLMAQSKKDSIRVVIALAAADDKIERSYGYWQARAALEVKVDMYGYVGGKHLYKTFDMQYDYDENAWVVYLPKGYFELRVESLGFKDIRFPLRLKKDYKSSFDLQVDSTSYTYKNRQKYSYIPGTLNFNSTVLILFKTGEFADNRAFLTEALALEGLEHLNVLRSHKVRNANAFLITLDIADQTPLNILLHDKLVEKPPIERGYKIGGQVTKAIEIFQQNPNVVYANPSFIDDQTQVFLKSAEYPQSDALERKLLILMEENTRTLDKINYIIDKTTPEELETEEMD